MPDQTGNFKGTRLGRLAIERGLLSREELEAVVARERDRVAAADARRTVKRRLIGEVLIAERYLTADVLDDLLDVQRQARDLPPVLRRGSDDATYEVQSPLLLDYITFLRRQEAQELLLIVDQPPAIRIADDLVPLKEQPVDWDRMDVLLREVFDAEEVEQARSGEAASKMLDHRFGPVRAYLSATDNGLALVCRPVSLDVAESNLRIPRSVAELAKLERGLVVIAGGRGSGRANVLAQLVDFMNEDVPRHIITVERQISYVHESHVAFIAQREVGTHTESYRAALKAALRQDPDVLVASEIDDAEAIATTITAAETGCLVFCSLHASDPTLAIRRLVDVQATTERQTVRATLANCLQAVVVLDIIPGRAHGERYMVADLVPASPAVTRLIRENRLHQLPAVASRETGVISRDDLILKLYSVGRITKAVALERLNDPGRLDEVGPDK